MKLNLKIYRLNVMNAPRRFIVDHRLARKVARFDWRYVPKMNRARATVKKGQARMFLHRYVALLARRNWIEIFFANNDPFDCRIDNLRPYRRDEEGARRKPFRSKRVKLKGVFLKRSTGKYGAAIRYKGKYHHLGYFATPEQAAERYRKEYNILHPNQKMASI